MFRNPWLSTWSLSLLLTFSLNSCATEESTGYTAPPDTSVTGNVKEIKPIKPVTSTPKSQQTQATSAINAFTTRLYAQLNSQEGNLFLSPYGISTALTMAYTGARGETESQMATALQFEGQPNLQSLGELQKSLKQPDATYTLNIANDIWVQRGMHLVADFTETLHDIYNTVLRTADFANEADRARSRINGKIAEQTGQKIKELLAPGMVTSQTRLVLTNAIYFKGKWQMAFDPKDTEEQFFLKLDNSKIKVPMMYQKGDFRSWGDADAQLLELPYKSSENSSGLSMIVLLPQQDGKESFATVENKLSDYLRMQNKDNPAEVVVLLPKFKLESTFQLREPLEKLGMKKAFDPATADFSGITQEKLAISDVIHKAFVEVNEEGTEATAATAVEFSRGMSATFRADHPFIFWVKDNHSGTVLFLGKVVDPTR